MSDSDDLAPEARVYRHTEAVGDPRLSHGDRELIDDVTRHLERFLGPVETVFHEIVSEYVHIDVHHFPPTPTRPFHVLATSGMSEKPMTTPAELPDDWRHAELLVCLSAAWPLTEAAFADERYYWPVRCLKTIARLPHVFRTWIGWAHTIPNDDPPQPYADDTALCGCMIVPPLSLGDEIHRLERANGTVVRFWNLLPLYAEEMELKLREGAEALFELLDRVGAADVVDPRRPNVVTGVRPR